MKSRITQKLSRLIQNLSPVELRYCRRYLGLHQGKDAKYLRLFNALLQKKNLDEKELAIKTYGPKGKPGSAFSELKNYLCQLLLKALNHYDENSTPAQVLDQELQKAQVLFIRGGYRESEQILKKVKTKARELEEWYLLLGALKLEQKIGFASGQKNDIETSEEVINCLEILENFNGFQNLYCHLFISIRTDALLRTKEKVAALKKRVDHPLLQNKDWKSQKAQMLYYRIFGLYAYSVLDYVGFTKYAQIDFKLSEERYNTYRDNTRSYISALNNLTLSFGLQNKIAEVEKLLPKYLTIKTITIEEKESCFIYYYGFKNNAIIKRGTFVQNLSYFEKQKREVKKTPLSNLSKRYLFFQYFQIHFALGEYPEALRYLSQCIDLLKPPVRKDMQNLYPLLLLIVHYELKNYRLLESLSRSLYRSLKKQKKLLRVEKSILRFLDMALNVASRRELQHAFIWLGKELKSLKEDPDEAILLKYFHFIAWIDSKVETHLHYFSSKKKQSQ